MRPSLALLALGVNLAITVPLGALLNIWQDEAYTLQTTGSSFGYAFRHAIGFEQNAPLYFLLMTAWRHAGENIFFLRLFSIVSIAIAVFLVPALVERYVPRANAALVTAAVALNPFVIWAAVELRLYAFVILLSALLLLSYYEAIAAERPSKGAVALYALCIAAALYTQYYLAFLVAAQAVTTVLYHRRSLARYLIAFGAGIVAFSPMLAIVPQQVANFKGGFAPPSLLHAVAGLGGILARYVLPLPVHANALYVVLLVAAAAAVLIARRAIAPRPNGEILVMTGCAFLLFGVASYVSGVLILDRHAASLYLPATLSVFAVLTLWRRPASDRLSAAFTAVAIVFSLVALARTYHGLAKPGDWIRADAYIQAHERPGEPIVVFEAENALPMAFYYRGPNRVVAIPQGVDFRRYDVREFVIQDEAQLASAMPGQRRIWLVTAGGCHSANLQFGCPALERYVGTRYRVESDASFVGSRVRLLERLGRPAREGA